MGFTSAATGTELNHRPQPQAPWTILIVDDHPLVRKGMTTLIGVESDLQVVGECAEMQEAIRLVGELHPSLVIVDISLKSGNGLELIKHLINNYPQVKMLVCSMHDESLFAERCLRAGAGGYLNKDAAASYLVTAIRSIREGRAFVSPAMSEKLLSRIVGGGASNQAPIETLTDRELEVFGLIGNGLTTRQISERLGLSYKTIESYRENIKAKLTLKNAAELNRHAVQWVLESC
ncbi:response regulator transcription factor [Planctomicrobium sp. SH668]|uniref:response regulator transcription factor n=1 Tax=Planctomicrobium sp. SH668 TaxID=3448126 RepID=UPI003F5C3D30